MQPIRSLLNKIKWDPNLNPDEYSIFYLDRIRKVLIEIEYNDIKKIENEFMILEKDDEVNIPLHRIRKVKRNKKLVWERKSNK